LITQKHLVRSRVYAPVNLDLRGVKTVKGDYHPGRDMTMLTRIPLRERARGQWREILSAIGIGAKHLSKKGSPCPMCGGADRFVYFDTNGDGTWYCRGCGKGAGADLVMRFLGVEFAEAAQQIEQYIGAAPAKAPAPAPLQNPRGKLRKIWAASSPAIRGDGVDTYLRKRGVGLDNYPNCLRTASSLRYYDDDASGTFPAMLAAVQDSAGKPITIHRTYLRADGRGKAPVEKPRKLCSSVGNGPTIRLTPIEPTLGIAEGIETAIAAAKLFGVPTWSVISTHGIETFQPPHGLKHLIVFADNDAKGAGQRSAYSLATRLAGLIAIDIKIPEQIGDWNDVLLK
jgi:putative DNA primase/helicase